MILSNKEFFINTDEIGESEEFAIGPKSSEILLSVFGTANIDLQILGVGAYPDIDYMPITYLNNDGYSTTNSITTNGKYYASVKGYTKIKCIINAISGGTTTVIGTISS